MKVLWKVSRNLRSFLPYESQNCQLWRSNNAFCQISSHTNTKLRIFLRNLRKRKQAACTANSTSAKNPIFFPTYQKTNCSCRLKLHRENQTETHPRLILQLAWHVRDRFKKFHRIVRSNFKFEQLARWILAARLVFETILKEILAFACCRPVKRKSPTRRYLNPELNTRCHCVLTSQFRFYR